MTTMMLLTVADSKHLSARTKVTKPLCAIAKDKQAGDRYDLTSHIGLTGLTLGTQQPEYQQE